MANILLVHDDPEVRRHLRALLEEAGHQVTEAPDGQAGLGLTRAVWPGPVPCGPADPEDGHHAEALRPDLPVPAAGGAVSR